MTSRFVSGGTITGDSHNEPQQQPTTSTSPPKTQDNAQWDKDAYKKNAEWEAVQKDLEAERRRREEARRAQVEGGAGGERSLYEILQANKAAKQAAFEEQNRIRNQFRALDDDEIEFLDGVRDERRVEEERVKRETEERLASFRQAQKAAGISTAAEDVEDNRGEEEEPVTWRGPGKKRKRSDKEVKGIVKGVKRRASEHERAVEVSAAVSAATAAAAETEAEEIKADKKTEAPSTDTKPKSSQTAEAAEPTVSKTVPEKPKPKLGLVDYGSDEDDDD